jgi:hypothetical protein
VFYCQEIRDKTGQHCQEMMELLVMIFTAYLEANLVRTINKHCRIYSF